MRMLIFLKFCFVLSMGILLAGFEHATHPIHITGHLYKNGADSSTINTANLIVFVKGDKKILAKGLTDDKGDFTLTFTPKNEKTFDFYCSGLGTDTMLLSSISFFESDTPDIKFYLPGKHQYNKAGKVICPKCKKTKTVYTIKYSSSPVLTRYINKSGDTSYSRIHKGTYQESCIAGPARFYCSLDKVKF